jgi:hypothetical protein
MSAIISSARGGRPPACRGWVYVRELDFQSTRGNIGTDINGDVAT